LPEINQLDEKIADHRKAKDEQRTKVHNLDEYCESIDRLKEFSDLITNNIPAFQEWQRRERRRVARWVIGVPTGLVILGFLLAFLKDLYFRHYDRAQTQKTPTSQVAPVSPAPSPSPSP
jgi:hypothetical protein